MQGSKDGGLTTYCFFLYVQKACDTVWRNELRKNMWEIGIRGKMWRMMKILTECARSVVMLDGEISKYVDIHKVLHSDVHYLSPNYLSPIYSRYTLMTWYQQSKQQSKESRWGKTRCRG